MVHGENHFYTDSYLSIGPRGVDFPLPCFQAAYTPCHVNLCWCSTLRHQRSPVWHWRSAKAKITHCVFEIRYSVEIMLGMFTAIRERLRGLFSGYLELLVHSFSHIVYFRWGRRVIWTTQLVAVQTEMSWGEMKMEDSGYSLEVEPTALADGLAMEGHEEKVEAGMTHGFLAWATEQMVEALLVEFSNKGKWEGVSNEQGDAWKPRKERVSKTLANCGGRWYDRLNYAPCLKISTL